MWCHFVLICALATAGWASIVPTKPERRLADEGFLRHQKQVLDLYVGLGHTEHFSNEYSYFDINANLDKFTDPKYPMEFLKIYKTGFLPYNGVFTMSCHHTRKSAIKLFDLFYFAKDFDTFIKVASWARTHINPGMFGYVYTMALLHRNDCQTYKVPPLYEVAPNLFVPTDTLHDVHEAKILGRKEGKFTYNNTGYEYNYHQMYGGVLDPTRSHRHGEFRISYFREDVGLNDFYAMWSMRNPAWMCPQKYGKTHMNKRGETFYQMHEQLLARYTLERTSWDLPFVDILRWEEPIMVGYNPRISYVNGQPFFVRPDGIVPMQFNRDYVKRTEAFEKRVWDIIDYKMQWNLANNTVVTLTDEDGIELLGRNIYGTTDSLSKGIFKSQFYAALEALGFIVRTGSDKSFIGNALTTSVTAARDPVFYNLLARLQYFFQHYKHKLSHYKHTDLVFKGVTVQNFEVDKFLTFFEMFDYEVTNGIPMVKEEDYTSHKYVARQYRLNHKPYHYKVTVNSETTVDAIVRVYIGLKHDSDYRTLSLNQARLSYFEIDRFVAQLSAGVNVLERSSQESPLFINDPESFRSLYEAVNKKEPFYITERKRCGWPSRLQLPMGWEEGETYTVAVVVSPYDSKNSADEKSYEVSCGISRFYDGRPMGYPFDRPIHESEFKVPNILFQDVNVYLKEEAELNRP